MVSPKATMTFKSLYILAALLLISPISPAQNSIENIQAKIKSLSPDGTPPEDKEESERHTILKNSLTQAKTAKESAELTKSYIAQTKAAPKATKDFRQNPPKVSIPASPTEELTQEQLEQSISDITAEQETNKSLTNSLRSRINKRAESLDELPEQLATARAELNSLAEITPPPATATEINKANYQLKIHRKKALQNTIAKLEARRDLYNAEADLLAAKLQVATTNTETLNKALTNWQRALQQKRISDAEASRKLAQRQISQLSNIPELADIAQSNANLAQTSSGANGISAKLASISQYKAKIEESLSRVKTQRNSAENRIELLEKADLEIDTETGALLRRHRAGIPDIGSLKDDLKKHVQESATAQLHKIDLQAIAAEQLTDIDTRVDLLFEKHKKQGVKKETIRDLLTQRRDLLDGVIDDHRTYLDLVKDTNDVTRRAIQEFSDYALYLDERLLWIPSAERITLEDIPREANGLLRLLSPPIGERWLQSMLTDITSYWFLWIPATLIVLILFIRKNIIRKKLIKVGEAAARRNCTSFIPTLQALIYSLALAAPIPIMSSFLAWRTDSTSPFYTAFISLALFTGFVGFFRRLCRPKGILESHIKLDPHRTILIRKNLLWYLPLMMPVVFIVSALLNLEEGGSIGRVFFILAMSSTWVLLFNLTKPSNKLFCQGHEPTRFAKTTYILCLTIPLILITGAALGYFSSVLTIRKQILASLTLILIVTLVVALLLRWGLVSRRNLALKQALRRREATIAERKKAQENAENKENPDEKPSDLPTLEEVKAEAVDVADVQEKTAHLIKVVASCALAIGLYGVWSTSLPALSGLDDIRLWGDKPASQEQAQSPKSPLPSLTPSSQDESTEESSTSEESKETNPITSLTEAKDEFVSLQDLLVFFLALFLTYTAARNIPSLLELTLLNRLDLKPGSSFAVTTAITYSIVVIGIVIAFAKIGITWGKVQWLAAAVTLGIGFGLQEIFANFVAGLILLFERPIRLGDYITVGDVSGRVTQIKIRATTIQQLNNRELIVPNKEFITGQVVNWTLKDPVLRAEVLVGIAYGSDVELAKNELIKVAQANPRVVKNQKTDVIFQDFADSTLNMLLRTHVSGIENFIPVHSELRFDIDKAFRNAEIEIAFPQRDIHIRSVTNLTDALKTAEVPSKKSE